MNKSSEIQIFETGEWWEYRYPFRHFRGVNALSKPHLEAVELNFRKILDATAGKCTGKHKLTQTTRNYDAQMLAIDESIAPLFFPLFSDAWIRALYDVFKLPYLARIDGALHSSPKNSRTGWIHTDHCSAWFDESIDPGVGVLFPNRARCQYFDGLARVPGAKPKEYVRAATLIFYLCNDGWQLGDGGETALYGSPRQGSNTRYDVVPPINNTLLLFECSPHSHHRFIANPGRMRNSIILWLHSSLEYTESRWGAGVINHRGLK